MDIVELWLDFVLKENLIYSVCVVFVLFSRLVMPFILEFRYISFSEQSFGSLLCD